MEKKDRRNYQKKYYQEHKEYYRNYHKQYRKENREKLNEYGKKYRQENKEKRKVYLKKYCLKNREKLKEYKKRYRLKNREKLREYMRSYSKKYPERIKAYKVLNLAIKIKKIKREPCEVCGKIGVHGHHTDYSRPLLVTWLCPRCHKEEHLNSKGRILTINNKYNYGRNIFRKRVVGWNRILQPKRVT